MLFFNEQDFPFIRNEKGTFSDVSGTNSHNRVDNSRN